MQPQTIPWVGGEHEFVLNIGELRALQKNCEASPNVILARIAASAWFVDDIVEVLRLGLVGAGMVSKEANELVLRMFDLHGPVNLSVPAHLVLVMALTGEIDDPVGEADGVNLPENSGSSPDIMPGEQ